MRSIIIGAIMLAFPLVSQAKDTMDGCGLGWEVTDSETMIGTTTRGTTNMFVPPAFGMTTGTIGCGIPQKKWIVSQAAFTFSVDSYSKGL
ncbi:MAG: DUF3015 family protein [Bdellovibrionales bacterium]|nr:DUF3015 family protein [Bdellovibrionales bacterium]